MIARLQRTPDVTKPNLVTTMSFGQWGVGYQISKTYPSLFLHAGDRILIFPMGEGDVQTGLRYIAVKDAFNQNTYVVEEVLTPETVKYITIKL